jgi:hypothetical protein
MAAQLQSELDSVMKSRAEVEARVANRGLEARAAEAEQEAEAIVSRLIPAIISITSHLETDAVIAR